MDMPPVKALPTAVTVFVLDWPDSAAPSFHHLAPFGFKGDHQKRFNMPG
jgi:hypothetical protein